MTNADRTPLFSVVIATYNRANLIARSVNSVLNGAFRDLELIVVDDGSTDTTAEVLARIGDDRLEVIQQENRGRTAARNRGASVARGRYLTFLDSDDFAEPQWLQSLFECFHGEPKVGVVCCGCHQVWLDSAGVPKRHHEQGPADLGPMFFNQTGLFLTGTYAVDTSLFRDIGGYNESMSRGETTELALRLIPALLENHLSIASTPEVLIRYEQCRPPMTTRDHQARLRDAETMLDVHGRSYIERNPTKRADYFAIAGASSAYLGDFTRARKSFVSAIRDDPRNVRSYGRLALSLVPPVGRRVWRADQ
jgi:glycosyltransferase involved in cell wall biosynthesis